MMLVIRVFQWAVCRVSKYAAHTAIAEKMSAIIYNMAPFLMFVPRPLFLLLLLFDEDR